MSVEEEDLEILQQFHDKLAETATSTRSSEARLSKLSSRAPPALVEFWRQFGWCSYLGGLLRTVDPVDLDDVKADWGLPKDALVIARSGFGDLLALSENHLVTIYVHTGTFQKSSELSYAEYLATQFHEDDIDDLFFGDLYREATEKLGTPSNTEIFTFEPALALGGDTTIEHVARVGMKPALAFLAQLHDKLVPY